ncbi:MAG: hypothetical protein ACRECH_08655, partial [Nitrososphaerales archaeon]
MTEQDASEVPAIQGRENGEEETKFMQTLEKLDEESIEQEIQGMTVFEDLFYETKDHKAALTWKGVKELRNTMREQGRPISIVHLLVNESHGHGAEYGKPPLLDYPCTKYCKYNAIAVAKLMNTGERSPAEADQTVLMEVYDYDKKTGKRLETTHYEIDPFARRKAVSKGKRNAIRDFIPEFAITKAYERWKAVKAGGAPKPQQKVVGHGTASENAQAPPPEGEINP